MKRVFEKSHPIAALDDNAAVDHNVELLNDSGLWFDVLYGKILSIDRGGLTQEKIAEKMNVKAPRVNEILLGRRDLRMGTIVRFALALGMVPHLVFEPIRDYARRVVFNEKVLLNASGRIEPCAQVTQRIHGEDTFSLSINPDGDAALLQRHSQQFHPLKDTGVLEFKAVEHPLVKVA